MGWCRNNSYHRILQIPKRHMDKTTCLVFYKVNSWTCSWYRLNCRLSLPIQGSLSPASTHICQYKPGRVDDTGLNCRVPLPTPVYINMDVLMIQGSTVVCLYSGLSMYSWRRPDLVTG
ncbi:hypothetical protein PoB_006003200 [Plakobranchus ocellatus]|uniref:Uncharacterized protein n=1 Tax=Plakobranchus ocellatus TaxID=259542 RepID=A0AAV4CNR6_9GAST|nr:hypothetical protein PoB_006003200 [Plakobranchus ocellatus]